MIDTISDTRPRREKGSLYLVFKMLAWVNGLIAVCLAFLLALPSFIDWGQYKDKISHHAHKHLGAHVKIEGAVYAQFLPVPVLKLNRVVITNPQNPNTSPLFVKRADVELEFLALLKGDLKPSAFLLKEPELIFGLTKDKSWLVPVGLEKLFLGAQVQSVSRFGVSGANIHLSQGPSKSGHTIKNIDFKAEKTADAQNWVLHGLVKGKGTQHAFQLSTRSRPEQNQTFIDAQLKMSAGGNIAYSFNGSLTRLRTGIELEGRYQASGTYGEGESAQALSARGLLKVSERAVNLTGSTLSISPASESEQSAAKPAILNADVSLTRQTSTGKWAINSDVLMENFNSSVAASLFAKGTDPIKQFHKFNHLADLFEGDLSIRAKKIKMGSRLFPASWANIRFLDGLMHIESAGLGLPGGGKLQTDRLRAGFDIVNGQKEIFHTGKVYLKSQSISDLALFLPFSAREKTLGHFSKLNHAISVSGDTKFGSQGFSFTSQAMNVGGSDGRLDMSVSGAKKNKTHLALHLQKMNVDRYFKSANKSFVQAFTQVIKKTGQAEVPVEKGHSSKLRISVGKLLWHGTVLKDFRLQGKLTEHNLVLTKLSAGDQKGEGLQLMMTGGISNLSSRPNGSFDLSVKSREALDVLSLVSPDFAVSKRGRALLKRSQIISPFVLEAKIASKKDAQNRIGWGLDLEGRAASTVFSSQGEMIPNWGRGRDFVDYLDAQIEFSNESGRTLARQIFALESGLVKHIRGGEGFLRASLSGSSEKGFEVAFGTELSDVQATLGGHVKFIEGKPAIAGQVKLISPDSRSLLSFVGLKSDKHLGRTDFSATLAGSGSEYVLSGGRGKLWGRDTKIEGKLDFSAANPLVSAHILTNAVRQKTLHRAASLVFHKLGQGERFFGGLDTNLSFTSPVLTLKRGVNVKQASAQFKLRGDKIELSQFTGKVFNGSLLMKGQMGKKGKGVALSGQYELKDAKIETALAQENLNKIATGRFTLAGEIKGRGDSLQTISRSLTGQGYVKASKGSIGGLNPAAFGRSVRFVSNGTELDGMIGGILAHGTLPYSQFQTAFHIKNSVVETSKTQLISREVRTLNKTQIDLVSGKVSSEWAFQVLRLPNTPALKLVFQGTRKKLKRQLLYGPLRRYLLALMQNGEKLDQRFAAAKFAPKVRADRIETGSIRKQRMKKPIKLKGLKIVPKENPLRGSK